MVYLLWQIFACLLGTAVLFLILGWLLRNWWLSRNPSTDNLTADSERSRWQNSLDAVKARLESETGRTLAAEKALEDSRGQQSKISSLLDQHTTEIRTLAQELTDKGTALEERDVSLKQLQARIAELESQHGSSQKLAQERDGLNTQLAAVALPGATRDQLADLQQSLQASRDEANKLKAQESDLQKKLSNLQMSSADTIKRLADLDARNRAFAEENEKLKAQLADLTPKLATATAVASEAAGSNARIAEIDGQLRDGKFRNADDELASFKKRAVEHEGKFRAVGEENARLKAQLAEYELKLKQAQQYDTEEIQSLRLRLASLEPQVRDWETRYVTTVAEKDAELSQYRSRIAELEQHAKPDTAHDHSAPKGERDDLKKIFGIGPVLEKRLNSLGVYFFREIAMWTKEDIVRYEEHLKEFQRRIERDKWVEGAREEHFKKYGERLLKADSAKA
jgi:predicted flap endonuclease-1-like 5' DNA nuclease